MHTSTRIGFALFAGLILGALLGSTFFAAPAVGALAGAAVGTGLAWALDRGES